MRYNVSKHKYYTIGIMSIVAVDAIELMANRKRSKLSIKKNTDTNFPQTK